MKKHNAEHGLPIIHARAVSIDISSRFHVVAVPTALTEEPVQTFQAFTADLEHGGLAGRARDHYRRDGVDRHVLDTRLRDPGDSWPAGRLGRILAPTTTSSSTASGWSRDCTAGRLSLVSPCRQ